MRSNRTATADLACLLLEATGVPMLMFDREGLTVLANRAVRDLHGGDLLVGRPAWEVVGLVPGSAPAGLAPERTYAELVQRCLLDRPVADHEHVVTTPSGARRRISWRFTAVRDGSGGAQLLVGTGIDVTRERLLDAVRGRQAEAAQLHVDHTDAETGVANRLALDVCLSDHLDIAHGAGCALLALRLEPGAGDDQVASRRALVDLLRTTVRVDDVVARVGDDEFVVVLPAAGPLDVRAVSSRVERLVGRPVKLANGSTRLSVCVAFHVADPGQSTATVLERTAAAVDAVAERRRAARQRVTAASASRPR